MTSLKFFFVASLLVACVAALEGEQQVAPVSPANPAQGDDQIAKRDKKDVLLSTITYPQTIAQPAVPLLKTISPISEISPINTLSPINTISPLSTVSPINTVSPISTINPLLRTAYPYSYYPYSYYPYTLPYTYPNNVYYLRK